MSLRPGLVAAAQGGKLECAAASAAQTKLRATKGAQLRLKTNVRRNRGRGDAFQLRFTRTFAV